MDKTMEYNSFNNSSNYNNSPNYNSFDSQFDSSMYETPMINPVMQYEQAYMYYKYLSQQMDYRIKCKEFEKMNSKTS